jgi:hypothetical protein
MKNWQSNGERERDAGLSGVHEEAQRNLSVGDEVEYENLGDRLEEIVELWLTLGRKIRLWTSAM